MPISRLIEIMNALREKCPWDRKQTRESLKAYLLEETYEALEALDHGDPEKIKEELGDLLFQIIFHAHIGKERGEFDMDSIIQGIAEKMVRRHPHVFGDATAETPEDVSRRWEEIKRTEGGRHRQSLLDGVPSALPSLQRAHRLQSRAAKVGFDWEKLEDLEDKLREELGELREAIEKGDRDSMAEEFGDLFFMLVNLARFTGVNAEDAHRRAIEKFISRFHYIESEAKKQGRKMEDMTLSEMDCLWDEAKKKERE